MKNELFTGAIVCLLLMVFGLQLMLVSEIRTVPMCNETMSREFSIGYNQLRLDRDSEVMRLQAVIDSLELENETNARYRGYNREMYFKCVEELINLRKD